AVGRTCRVDKLSRVAPPAYRLGKFVRRHQVFAVAASLVVLALVTGAAAATFGLLRAQQAEQVARTEARTAEEVSEFLTSLFRVSEPSAVDVNSITAREVLDRGVDRIRLELANEPVVQSRLMQEMGAVYAQLGLLEDASRLLQEALDLRRSLPDATARDIAETMASLASVRHLAARHAEAIALYEQAIEQVNTASGAAEPLWLATVYRSLGGVYDSTGELDKALDTMRTARATLERAGLADTAEYARVIRNTGISYWGKGDYPAARKAYDEALAVYDRVLEPGHPEVSYVVNSLAILNYNLGDYEAARPMFERELANLERTLGREHQHTASVMNNLGLLLLEMELLDEATPLIEESLATRERVLGPVHEDIATSLMNRGRLRLVQEQPQLATEDLVRCLSIREEVLGSNHPFVAATLELYAEALRANGDVDRADQMERRARTIRDAAG
ncbi:MAG: tetratricopeptide repeat protein, partial [Pseudomonadota bacterium]